jgi:parvulin-like peptidyl-prolyl isomerase
MTRKNYRDVQPRRARRGLRLGMLVGGLGVVAIAVAARYYWGADTAGAQTSDDRSAASSEAEPSGPESGPAPKASGKTSSSQPSAKIMAMVNREEITREDLARESLWHYGKEVLESLVNKHLIVQECAKFEVTVTQDEVNAEINRLAARFGLPVDRWMKLLEEERGVNPTQYANDIIWPTLALRKLAGKKLQATDEEVQREFETQYGPAVQVRLIMCKALEKAQRVQAAAAANPDDFGKLAKQFSEDVNSASAEGLIQPIRMNVGYKEIETAAFALQDGQVSPVIAVGDQHVVLRRERLIKAREINGRPVQLADVAENLREAIRDQKMRGVASKIFEQLQANAKVENVFNDPVKREQMPGVAAVINGRPIPLRDLAEECITRHGKDVLAGMINRRLIEQACRKRSITVSDAELDQEVVRAAAMSVPAKADGSPDVDAYLKLVVKEQNINVETFRRDAVWPSVALKKLVGNTVQVTEEDVDRGFEANYGRRVRCRAIVLNDQRRAQDVWEKARAKLTPEFFGELAKQYSVDATSGSLGGQIPPVKRWGGQPTMEEYAFGLNPGELSRIFQIEGKFVILYCEGYTEPVKVSKEEVRKGLYEDIFEKKQRLAMGKYFQNLQDSATIDNYLAGTVRTPKSNHVKAASFVPPLQQVPAEPKAAK